MAGLVTAIHAFAEIEIWKGVDARHLKSDISDFSKVYSQVGYSRLECRA
jgi:hypothetical protein